MVDKTKHLGALLKLLGDRAGHKLDRIRPLAGRRWIDCVDYCNGAPSLWYDELLPDGSYTTGIIQLDNDDGAGHDNIDSMLDDIEQ